MIRVRGQRWAATAPRRPAQELAGAEAPTPAAVEEPMMTTVCATGAGWRRSGGGSCRSVSGAGPDEQATVQVRAEISAAFMCISSLPVMPQPAPSGQQPAA